MDALQLVAAPRRRDILRLVWIDEVAAGEIASHFDSSFAAVSQHLALLREAGFVSVRREGKRRLYRANHAALGPLKEALEQYWASHLDRLTELAQRVEAESGDPRTT